VETAEGRREYLIYRPPGPSADTPLPLVLNFHGRGSDAAIQERYSGLLPVAERVGFVVATPEGTGSPRAWSAGATPPNGIDDVAFVARLLDAIEAEMCIDATRVYATGFSNGAFMASKVACHLGDRIAAFAAVAGIAASGSNCKSDVPALAMHGTRDGIVPFEKGSIRSTYPYAGARGELQGWAENNGCASKLNAERLSQNIVRETYASGRAPVVLYIFQGAGHTWPGAPDSVGLGVTVRELNAAETIWAFFSSYSRQV
jgi:polyhydroxybutyrate depolymerase